MSQAEALLNNLTDDQIATYTAAPETEPHIVIGADRFIIVPEELKRLAVQHDNDIETVVFDCPRYWDEHDLSAMKIYINYMNGGNKPGSFLAENVAVDKDDDSIMHFAWTISRNVTEYKGDVSFLVCAKTTDTDGEEKHHWNSELNKDCFVSEGLEVEDVVLNDYPDIVTQLLLRMDTVEEDWDTFKAEVEAEVALLREHVVGQGFVSRYGDTMEGPLMMPNGADAPVTETVSNAYTVRQAGGTAAIVDGSMTEVLKIEGNSAPSENLITYPYNISSATVNDVEVTVNSNGSIKLNGQASAGKDLIIATWPGGKIFNGTYTISCGKALPEGSFFWATGVKGGRIRLLTAGNTSAQVTINDTLTEFGMWMSIDGAFSNLTIYPMINPGVNIKPFRLNYKGLKNASIKSIKHTGKNLCNFPEELTFTRSKQFSNVTLPAGTYRFSCESFETAGTKTPVLEIRDERGGYYGPWYLDRGATTLTLPGGTYRMTFYSNGYDFSGSADITATIRKVMFNLGDPIPYEPYTEGLYELPKTVECGLGTVIDIPNRKVTNYGVDLVLTGEEDWKLSSHVIDGYSTYALLNAFDSYPVGIANSEGLPNFVDQYYNMAPFTSKVTVYPNRDTKQLIITIDNSLADSNNQTDVTAWKAYLAQRYAAGDPFTIRYVSQNVQSEEYLDGPIGVSGSYPIVTIEDDSLIARYVGQSWYPVIEGGMEAIVADDTGAILTDVAPIITQVYRLHTNPDEAATQGYVDRGLAEKADKTYVDAEISTAVKVVSDNVAESMNKKVDKSYIPEIQKHSDHSDDSSAVNGLAFTKDDDGILRIGDIVIPYRKPIWTRSNGLVPGTYYNQSDLNGVALIQHLLTEQTIDFPAGFDADIPIHIQIGVQEIVDWANDFSTVKFGHELIFDCGAFYPGRDYAWDITVSNATITIDYNSTNRSFTATSNDIGGSVKAIYQSIGTSVGFASPGKVTVTFDDTYAGNGTHTVTVPYGTTIKEIIESDNTLSVNGWSVNGEYAMCRGQYISIDNTDGTTLEHALKGTHILINGATYLPNPNIPLA